MTEPAPIAKESTTHSEAWVRCRLCEVAELLRGVTYRRADASAEPAADRVPILRATNISGSLTFDGLVYVPQSYVGPQQMLRPGDIVLAASSGSRDVVGKSARLATEWQGSFGAFCFCVRPSQQIDSAFVSHFMQTAAYRQHVSSLAAGVNINNLKREHVEQITLPLPPLPEQRRIVEEIEKQLTRLDAAVAALERARANLKRYRAAVLKAACEGRLVPTEAELARTEGRDYETGEQLLARILTERRARWEADQLAKMRAKGQEPKNDNWKAKYTAPVPPPTQGLKGLPEGWWYASPDEVAANDRHALAIGPFGSNLKVADYTTEGVPLVFVRNIRAETFGGEPTVYVSTKKAEELTAHRTVAGDILVTKMGDPPGDVCLYPDSAPPAIITADCIKLTVQAGLIDRSFCVVAIRSAAVQAQILSITRGVAQKKVSLSRFRRIALPLPPKNEQRRIANEVERLDSIVQQADGNISRNLRRAQRLRQSILKRAFKGKLVPQDPNDEPAAVLLDRIRAERGGSGAEARGRRRRISSR